MSAGGFQKILHVAISPITNRIYCGSILKDGRTWASNKSDVTGQACAAVAQHVVGNGAPVIVTANGCPRWEITVRELMPKADSAPGPGGGA